MHSVEYKGKTYVFENTRGESDTMFIDRCWFVVKNYDKYDYPTLEAMSYVWVNKKYLKCNYTNDLSVMLETCSGVYDKIN